MDWESDVEELSNGEELSDSRVNAGQRAGQLPVSRPGENHVRSSGPAAEAEAVADAAPALAASFPGRTPMKPQRSRVGRKRSQLPDFLQAGSSVRPGVQASTARRRKSTEPAPGVTRLSSVPQPGPVGTRAQDPGAVGPRIGEPARPFARRDPLQDPDADYANRVVDANNPVSLAAVRKFVRHLRDEGNLVYLFAEELAAITYNFKVEHVLNVHVNQIDAVEFAKSYPWVVYSLSNGQVQWNRGPFLGPNGAVDVQARIDGPADALDALHDATRDVYGFGEHLHDLVEDFKRKYGGAGVGQPLLIGASSAPNPGDGTFTIYNRLLLKPEVMGLVRQALADINNWHHAYQKNQFFIFDDMLSNATVRSMFARYCAFVRARSYDVGGSVYTGMNQYGMPFSRSNGKTQAQLEDQYGTILGAQRFFLTLRKRASGIVEVGPYRDEDKRLAELRQQQQVQAGGRASRFSASGSFVSGGGDVLTNILSTF